MHNFLNFCALKNADFFPVVIQLGVASRVGTPKHIYSFDFNRSSYKREIFSRYSIYVVLMICLDTNTICHQKKKHYQMFPHKYVVDKLRSLSFTQTCFETLLFQQHIDFVQRQIISTIFVLYLVKISRFSDERLK